MSTPGPEPDLGPAAEAAGNGAEPADASYIDRGWAPDPPEAQDVLDTAHGAAEARRRFAAAFDRVRAEAAGPEPEAGQ